MDFIRNSWKAIAGFAAGVAGVIVERLASGDAVLPALSPFDGHGWLVLLGIGVLGYLGVYVPRNKLRPAQVARELAELPPTKQTQVVAAVAADPASPLMAPKGPGKPPAA